MKKSIQIIFHLLFWTITITLVYFILDILYGLISVILMHAGKVPENMQELHTFLIILSSGIIIFYSSYFSLHYFAKKPGHELNNEFIKTLFDNRSAWSYITVREYNKMFGIKQQAVEKPEEFIAKARNQYT